MSVRKIPATIEVTCDCCERVCDTSLTSHARRISSGKVTIDADALDFSGCAVGNATRTLDLCDNCLHAIDAAIIAAINTIRKEKQ